MAIIPFEITRRENSSVTYQYQNALQTMGARPVAEIAEGAEPLITPKCAPECSPARPCMSAVCPGRGREYTDKKFLEWEVQQSGLGCYWSAVAPGEFELLPSPPPELRCEREWGCDLVRTRR